MTCGGWDGTSCTPPPIDARSQARTRAEYDSIDSDARASCPEGDLAAQIYTGSLLEVLTAADTALDRAFQIDARLERLRTENPAPVWQVATYARAGSVYDCIWTSVRRASPSSYYTAQQQALLQKLGQLTQQLQQQGGQAPSNAQAMSQYVEDRWNSKRDQYLALLGRRMVSNYLTAAVLARRYALEGYWLTRAADRLPSVAKQVGNAQMSAWTLNLKDPTDPEPDPTKRRRLNYMAWAIAIGL